jgi:hypothetical protein
MGMSAKSKPERERLMGSVLAEFIIGWPWLLSGDLFAAQ